MGYGNNNDGLVDVAFGASTQGRFGVKAKDVLPVQQRFMVLANNLLLTHPETLFGLLGLMAISIQMDISPRVRKGM